MQEDDKTEAKTLWSETILEVLYASLNKNKDDSQIRSVLLEIRQKGYSAEEILKKVENHVSAEAATRIRRLLQK